MLSLLENLNLNIKNDGAKRKVWDIIRNKWIVLSPEEYVRQALVHYLINTMNYPLGLISVEKQIKIGSLVRRYDIVVFDRDMKPWLLVECKAPEVSINEQTMFQIIQYHGQIPCPYWLLSNGVQTFCAKIENQVLWQNELPQYPN